MSPRPQTRAKWLGIQPSRLRASSYRRIAAIKGQLLRLAHAWGDADPGVIEEIDALVARLQPAIDEALERLEEPMEDGW